MVVKRATFFKFTPFAHLPSYFLYIFKLNFYMRKILFLLLALPLLGISQTKNVVSSTRVFPKVDKVAEFEKALAAHAKKYHTGDFKWRVFEIESGPDAGGYHTTEGPLSWESIDSRGNLGAEHTNDWNKNVAIYLTDRNASSYGVFQEDLSTVSLTDYANRILINHMYPKPGMLFDVRNLIQKMKKAWEAGSESVAVYNAFNSGDPQYSIVTRLKGGLKAYGALKPMDVRYNEVNGAGSWDSYIADYTKFVERRWSEMLSYRADLSSK